MINELPQDLYSVAQCRELDRLATTGGELTGELLMERAGAAVLAQIRQRFPDVTRLCVVCGVGNNGGDGYVVARLAREVGLDVALIQVGDANKLPADARTMADRFAALGESALDLIELENLDPYEVIVDALLGTGVAREVDGEAREAIELMNASGKPVIAVDVPSGLQADVGQALGTAVRAVVTVTFIGLKVGLLTGAAADYVGELVFADLGVTPSEYPAVEPVAKRIGLDDVRANLPPRARDCHKGMFGHVLAIGGDYGMAGAIRLAGEAALRVGAGLVSIATRPGHESAINAARPELMCSSVDSLIDLTRLIDRASVLAVGPGLGRSGWSNKLLRAALAANKTMVLDADALQLLPGYAAAPPAVWILTPHPGEAATLLARETHEIQADRVAAAKEIAHRYQAIAVLKGAGTVVADPEGRVAICAQGNPGMAVAGMGDVLTGVIAGLLAQRLPPFVAACCGVWLHASAGDLAAREGERGMLALDLMPYLRGGANAARRD